VERAVFALPRGESYVSAGPLRGITLFVSAVVALGFGELSGEDDARIASYGV
jgi:hypothetical protein